MKKALIFIGKIAFITAVVFGSIQTSFAQSGTTTVILQDGLNGYTGTSDARVEVWNKTTNYGSETSMYARTDRKPLYKFDLSSIPSGATISSATLELYITGNNNNGGGNTLYLHNILNKNWVESEVTWNAYSTGNNWATEGLGSGTDYSSSADSSAQVGYLPANTWGVFPVTTLVQGWVSGTIPNTGVMLRVGNGPNVYINSSEFSDQSLRPKLTITYVGTSNTPTTTQTPTSEPAPVVPPPAPAPDTTAPTVPTGLTATVVSSSQINLSWSASTDAVGVTGYRIYRGGSQIGTSNTTSYSSTGLTGATQYSYTVSAYDAASNVSSQSTSVSATTQTVPVPVVTGGRVLNVSPSGSATSDCIATACTIDRAARYLALPGDTIEMEAGEYGEMQVRRWGTADKWITLRPKSGATVVIRGSGVGPSVNFYDTRCDEYAPAGSVCPSAYWHIDGITVKGSAKGGPDGNAIKIDLSDVKITNSKLCCSYADIIKAVRTASNITIDHNEFWQDSTVTPISSNAQGVDKTGGSDLKVTNNYFHDIPDVGAYAKGNACRPQISGNLLYNTGQVGANAGGSAVMLGQQTDASRLVKGCGTTTSTYFESYDGVAENNLIINAAQGCVGVSSSHNALVKNNICINTGTATGGRAAFQVNNESVADVRPGFPNGKQPSDYVEIRGNVVQNVQGKMFSVSGAYASVVAMDPWSGLVIADNVWSSTEPLWFRLSPNNIIYNGGNYTQWLTAYTLMTGHVDNSSTVSRGLDPVSLKKSWLEKFYNTGASSLVTAPAPVAPITTVTTPAVTTAPTQTVSTSSTQPASTPTTQTVVTATPAPSTTSGTSVVSQSPSSVSAMNPGTSVMTSLPASSNTFTPTLSTTGTTQTTINGTLPSGCTAKTFFSPLTGKRCTATVTTTVTTPGKSSYAFLRNLTVGSRGTDVKALQEFLNANGFTIATTGIGSKGKESTYFGPATRAALAKYQKAQNIQPTGFFGPTTRGKILK